jgi:hypothetical protein
MRRERLSALNERPRIVAGAAVFHCLSAVPLRVVKADGGLSARCAFSSPQPLAAEHSASGAVVEAHAASQLGCETH